MSEYQQNSDNRRALMAPIPLDKLPECSIEVIEDQLYTDKALTDLEHRQKILDILERKRIDMLT